MLSRRSTYGQPIPYRKMAYAGASALAGQLARRVGWSALNKAINSYRGSRPSRVYKREKPRRARTRRSYRRRRPVKKSTKKCVSELKKQVDADQGTHIYRVRDTGRVGPSTTNQTSTAEIVSCNGLQLETALTNLKYYDVSNPSVLLTAAGAAGTFSKKFLFKTIFSTLTCVNNYGVPCTVSVYVVSPKTDTSKTALECFTDGLADIGSPTATSPLVYFTDSDLFNDMYKIVKSESKYLQPGNKFSVSHSIKDLMYDPALRDFHTSTYQRGHGTHQYLVRITGPLGHDSTLNQQGILQCAVDYMLNRKFVIQYQAGADLRQIEIVDNSDTFTNIGYVNNRPDVGTQQIYSL